MNIQDAFLTVNEAASVLGISPMTLYYFINNNVIPTKRFGRQHVLSKKDVLTFKIHRELGEHVRKRPKQLSLDMEGK